MNKTYGSYIKAALLNRALAARREKTTLYFIEWGINNAIKTTYTGKKYITPVSMALTLDCETNDLCEALKMHKIAIGDLLLDGNYGNCNYNVSYTDKVYLQGWINFLSLPCYADSAEAKEAVRVLKNIKGS